MDTNRPKTKDEKALEKKRAILEAWLKRTAKRRVSKKEREEKLYNKRQTQHEHLHTAFNDHIAEARGIKERKDDGSLDSSFNDPISVSNSHNHQISGMKLLIEGESKVSKDMT